MTEGSDLVTIKIIDSRFGCELGIWNNKVRGIIYVCIILRGSLMESAYAK
jgi:hypothetical protein